MPCQTWPCTEACGSHTLLVGGGGGVTGEISIPLLVTSSKNFYFIFFW